MRLDRPARTPGWTRTALPLVCAILLPASTACRPGAPAAPTPAASPAPTSTRPPLVAPPPLVSPAASPLPSPSPATVRLGSVAVESGQAQQLQRDVDQGHTPWRLDPLQVAREDGQKLGFASGDRFELLRQTGGQATVRAVHGGQTYEIQLTQPAKTGPSGIWMIGEVRRAS